MSSAFRFEIPGGGGATGASLSGVHPGIYRPPVSPSLSSSMYLGRSTASVQSENAPPAGGTAKRKRLGTRESTPINEWAMATHSGGYSTNAITDDSYDSGRRVNERERQYVLAGRLETPNGGAQAQRELSHIEDSIYSDVDYRRALGPKPPHINSESPAIRPVPVNTWSSFAISTIGGVVGKVWEFCTSGAFRGFHAGGGRGYEMSTSGAPQLPPRHHQISNFEQYPRTLPRNDFDPLGRFPQSDHYEGETPESTPPPAAKRRQISEQTPNDELRRNWVMVSEPADVKKQSLASHASPRRPAPQPTTPSLNRRINKPVGRLSTPNYNRHHPSRASDAGSRYSGDHEPASRASFASLASPRSPVMAAFAPSRIPVPVQSRPQSPSTFSTTTRLQQQAPRIASPSPYVRGHRRSQSAISASSTAQGKKMKRRESLQEMPGNSPRLDAEARNLAAKRVKEEMETDIRMNDFNARLRDMIRQGQEALGTTIEVDMDDEFDGDMPVDTWEDE
ncbi:hypothetical protein F5Y16DRAFT_361954 [Xylariaceae sp. FL0255]|nr:hypothetical protein F5Y16DRAFT_361954 [Xylariaceae sp. FL0255]